MPFLPIICRILQDYSFADEIRGKDLLDEDTQSRAREEKVKKILAARKSLGPELEVINRRESLTAMLAKKRHSSLLAEAVFKQREVEHRELDAADVSKQFEKRIAKKSLADAELDPTAREMVDRLERERDLRLQKAVARRDGRRQPAAQPPLQRPSAQQTAQRKLSEEQQRAQSKVQARFARSIAQVCNALDSLWIGANVPISMKHSVQNVMIIDKRGTDYV